MRSIESFVRIESKANLKTKIALAIADWVIGDQADDITAMITRGEIRPMARGKVDCETAGATIGASGVADDIFFAAHRAAGDEVGDDGAHLP